MGLGRRVKRVPVLLSYDEHAELKRRAGSHRLSLSAFLRTAGLGEQTAAGQTADDWWNGLPSARREQIHRWVTASRTSDVTEHDQPLPLGGAA